MKSADKQEMKKKSVLRKIWDFLVDLISGISGALPF